MTRARRLVALAAAYATVGAAPAGAQAISGGLLIANPSSRIALGTTLEDTDGIWIGGSLGAEYGRFAVVVSGARGELTPGATGSAFERDVGEIAILGRYAVLDWLHADVEYVVRAFSTVVARQRWDILGLGAMAQHRLGNAGAAVFFRAAYFPVVNIDDLESPDFSVAADVGFRTPLPWLPLGLVARYRIERFDFPEGVASRADQFQYFQLQLTMSLRRTDGRWVVGGF